jgi:hypothetical protein
VNGIEDEQGNPVDLQDGDILTTDGGLLGLGHSAVVRRRNDKIEVIEVLDRQPEGDVHVAVHRTLEEFLDDYEKQGRSVFVSRPKKADGVTQEEFRKKVRAAVDGVAAEICDSFPIAGYLLNILWNLPDVWYCSEVIYEAYKKASIDLSTEISVEESSDNARDQLFLQVYREAFEDRLGPEGAAEFLGGFLLPSPEDFERLDVARVPRRLFGLGGFPASRAARLESFTSFEEFVGAVRLDNTVLGLESAFAGCLDAANIALGPFDDLLCSPPICYELTATPTNIKVENIKQQALSFGGCALVTDGDITEGAEAKVKEKFAALKAVQDCGTGCACLSANVFSQTINFSQKGVTETVTGTLVNCKVTFDLSFDIEIKARLGACLNVATLEDLPRRLKDLIKKLRGLWESCGRDLERLFDPDEILKKLRRITPRQLRENPNVEPPRKIRRKRGKPR